MEENYNCSLSEEECQKTCEELVLLVDGALEEDEKQALLKKIDMHPCCKEKFHKARSYKEFMNGKFKRRPVAPSLALSIMERISSSDDVGQLNI